MLDARKVSNKLEEASSLESTEGLFQVRPMRVVYSSLTSWQANGLGACEVAENHFDL